MEPTWVRAVYLYVMSFVGIVIIVFGTLGFALGVVHTAAPQLKSNDPFTSIATSLVDIAGSVANTANDNGSERVTVGHEGNQDREGRAPPAGSQPRDRRDVPRPLHGAHRPRRVPVPHSPHHRGPADGGIHPDYAAGFAAGLAAPHEPPLAPPHAPPPFPTGPPPT